jgi:hypothetical protein
MVVVLIFRRYSYKKRKKERKRERELDFKKQTKMGSGN